jgi:hypothetical protein
MSDAAAHATLLAKHNFTKQPLAAASAARAATLRSARTEVGTAR